MLKIVCPECQHPMSLTKFKPGKFAPTCKQCQTKFRLLIKQNDDATFYSQCALLPASAKPANDLEETQATHVPREATKAEDGLESTHATRAPVEKTRAHFDETRAVSGDSKAKQNSPTFADQQSKGQTRSDARAVPRGSDGNEPALGGHLGPYRLIKLLGQGGMGSVYLAKQTTLDRNVALKVIKTKLAERPAMMARFTREAYAAAQLVHPNVVQIYDMGDDRGNCYFSMELVPGMSLSDYVVDGKKVDPEQAASYVLHAARGLQCAHNAGMVHRDIKPANLLVDSKGVVKVADLGLVKVPDQEEIEDRADVDEMSALSASKELTRIGTAIGTPYYMAPEQARNSVTVDHRADIYSLGCTFYVLLTGKKPFEGKSFEEVVSKHTSAPLIVPSKLVARVPESLSGIVAKMMAKNPGDRYSSIGGVISELEAFLGISSTAAFTPEEQDAELLEKNVAVFNGVKLAKLRGPLPVALIAGSLLLATLMLFFSWRWATGFLVLPAVAIFSYFVIAGLWENSNLFSKSRELVFRSGLLSWLKWMAAGLLLIVATLLVGLWLPWLFLGLIGAGMGAAHYFLIDKPIHAQRQHAIKETESLLRKMRLKGMDELAIQMFAAKYSGKYWEELFEQVFGYAAKRRIRDEMIKSEIGKSRPRFWAWRDRISDSLDDRLEPLIEQKEKQHLEKVELAGLQAEGVPAADAKERAAQMAAALIDHGDSIRVAALQQRIAELDPEAQRLKQRLKVKQMLAEARNGQYRKPQSAMQRITPLLNRTLGSYLRFLLGCLLVVGSLLWARQNGFLEAVQKSAAQAQQAINTDGIGNAQVATQQQLAELSQTMNRKTEPLKLPIVGSLFFRNFNALIAGLILLSSSIVFGWRMSVFAIPAALIALWGASFGIPDIQPIQSVHALSSLIGVGIFTAGMLFGRTEK